MYFYNSLLLISNILIFIMQTQSLRSIGPGISGCTFLAYANKECGSGTTDVKIEDIPKECSSIVYDRIFVDLDYNFFADPNSDDRNQLILGRGISGCTFMTHANEECGNGTADVKIGDIPEECSFILYNGIFADLNYNIFADPILINRNKLVLDHLDEILQSGKQIYVYYGHVTQSEWSQMLANETSNGGVKSNGEMNGLKVFMGKHKGITGLILMALEYDSNSVAFPDYSENLKKYLDVMKKHFPGLEISIQIDGVFLLNQINYPKFPWLDFEVINPSVDFYIINLMYLNDCNMELINTGITPMSSSCTRYTMENVESALMQICIPKDKTYFSFRLNPNSDIHDYNTKCNLTIQSICADKPGTSGWCLDTQTSFNEKGQYAKKNGVGFITGIIDLNDPKNLCKCEKPFASFYALLDGFNGVNSKPCTSLSRA